MAEDTSKSENKEIKTLSESLEFLNRVMYMIEQSDQNTVKMKAKAERFKNNLNTVFTSVLVGINDALKNVQKKKLSVSDLTTTLEAFSSQPDKLDDEGNVTAKGRVGLFDTITLIFNMIDKFTKFASPKKLIKQSISIKLAKIGLTSMITDIVATLRMVKDNLSENADVFNYLINESKVLIDAAEVTLTAFDHIIDSCTNISKHAVALIAASKTKAFSIATKAAFKMLNLFIFELNNFAEKNTTKLPAAAVTMMKVSTLLNSFTATMLSFTYGMILIGLAAVPAMVGFIAFLPLLGAVFIILKVLSSRDFNKSIILGGTALKQIAGTFLLFTVSILLLSLAAAPSLIALLAFTLIVAAAVGILVLMTFLKNTGIIDDGAKALCFMGLAFLAFTMTLIVLTMVDFVSGKLLFNILVVAVTVALMTGILLLMNFMKGDVIKGSVALLILAGVMIASAIAFYLAANIMSKITSNKVLYQGLLWFGTGLLALLGVMLGIGAIMASSAGLMMVAGIAAVIGVASTLTILALAFYKAAVLMSATISVLNTIKNPKNIFSVFWNNLLKPMVKIAIASLSLLPFARSAGKVWKRIMPMIDGLSKMANIIAMFASMKVPTKYDKNGNPVDYKTLTDAEIKAASDNVVKLMTGIIGVMGSDEMKAACDNLSYFGTKNIERVMNTVSGMDTLINVIEKLAKKPISKETIDGVKTNITQLVGGYLDAINSVFNPQQKTESTQASNFFKKVGNSIASAAKGVAAAVGIDSISRASNQFKALLGTTTDLRALIDALKENTDDKIKNTSLANMSKLLSDYFNIINISVSKDIKWTQNRIDLLKNAGEALTVWGNIDSEKFKDISKETQLMMNSINGVELSKLDSVKDTFKEIAKLSESINGNFEGLADVLSDKLGALLEKLEGINGKIPTEVETTKATSTESTAARTEEKKQENYKEELENISRMLNDMLDGLPVYTKPGRPLIITQ